MRRPAHPRAAPGCPHISPLSSVGAPGGRNGEAIAQPSHSVDDASLKLIKYTYSTLKAKQENETKKGVCLSFNTCIMLQHVILSFNEKHIFLHSCDVMFIPSMHDRETTMATNGRCCVHMNAAFHLFVYLCIEKNYLRHHCLCGRTAGRQTTAGGSSGGCSSTWCLGNPSAAVALVFSHPAPSSRRHPRCGSTVGKAAPTLSG